MLKDICDDNDFILWKTGELHDILKQKIDFLFSDKKL